MSRFHTPLVEPGMQICCTRLSWKHHDFAHEKLRVRSVTVAVRSRGTLDSTEGLLSAVEAGLGVTFVSRWAVRNQLVLGTLKLTRVKGLNLSRKSSMAYPAGPTPVGIAGLFRMFHLARGLDAMPRTTGKAKTLRKREYCGLS
jgi:LysR family transcriptional regulator, transcriptional activator of the cysJI operon